MSRVPFLLVLALVATAVMTAAGVALGQPDGGFEARKLAPQPPPGTVSEVRGAPAAPVLRSEPASLEGSLEVVELLRAWDARRAQAWARGDPRLLRALYTPGSVAGRHDRAMLRAWAQRGLVVRQLRTQFLAVRELAHRPSAWTLLVTDRLAGGVAVGAGVRRPLPRDRASTRTVRLRRVHGVWRVASVRTGEVGPQAD
jgi:hypothetical protein